MGKPKNVLNMDRLLSTVVTGITTDMRDVVGGFKQHVGFRSPSAVTSILWMQLLDQQPGRIAAPKFV